MGKFCRDCGAGDFGDAAGVGYCHYHPATGASSRFPQVYPTDWCLQWTAKETPRTETGGAVGVDTRPYREEAKEVLAFLNEKSGRRYREIGANLDVIIARLKSGVTVQQCRTLIARKVRDWGTDEKMARYLRPETLFNRTKFEAYLAEVTL